MRGGGDLRLMTGGAVVATLALLLGGCAPGHETFPGTPRPTPVATPSSVESVTAVTSTATPTPTPSATVSPTLDRSRYAMTLTLDPAAKRLSGTVEVTLRNTSTTPWPAVCFRDWAASVLALFGPPGLVSGVSAATDAASGRALTVHVDATDPSVVFVDLATPLAPGDVTTISLAYATDVPLGNQRLSWQARPNATQVFDFGNFYPVLAPYADGEWVRHPYFRGGESFVSDCADYAVQLTLPDDYVVVSSGDEVKQPATGGLATWTVTADDMRDVAMVAAKGYAALTQTVAGVTVNSFYFTNNAPSKKQAEMALRAAALALPTFEAAYGSYPYDELDITQSDFFAGGMEYPSLVRIAMLSPTGPLSEYAGIASVVAHEIAHQWFYAVVGNDQYDEAWLDEGFASFSADAVFMSAYTSPSEVDDAFARNRVLTAQMPPLSLNRSIAELGANYYAVYTRGALFLYDLEQAMGEPAFLAMMRDYYASYSFTIATTADFLEVLARHSQGNQKVRDLIALNLAV